MNSPLQRTIGVALVLVSTAGLAACGKTVIDEKKAADAIKSNLEKAGATIKSVTCPADVESKAGKTLDCDIVSSTGAKATVTLHIKDSKGNVFFDKSDLHAAG